MKRWVLLMVSMATIVASAEEAAVSDEALRIQKMIEEVVAHPPGFGVDCMGEPVSGKETKAILAEPGDHAKDLGRLLDMSFPMLTRWTALEAMKRRNEYDVGLLNRGLEGWLKKCGGIDLKAAGPYQFEGGYGECLLKVMAVKGDGRSVDVALRAFPIKDESVASKVVALIGARGEQRHRAPLSVLVGKSEGKLKEEMLDALAEIYSRRPGCFDVLPPR